MKVCLKFVDIPEIDTEKKREVTFARNGCSNRDSNVSHSDRSISVLIVLIIMIIVQKVAV